jgi:Putative auto-transporter adhesin, head GIN domain
MINNFDILYSFFLFDIHLTVTYFYFFMSNFIFYKFLKNRTMKKNLLLILVALVAFVSCDNMKGNVFAKTKGTGPVQKFTRDVKDFKGIDIQASADVQIQQTTGDFKVVVETHKNIADIFETVVENDILLLRFKPNEGNVSYDKLIVYVDAPTYEKLIVSGSGNFTGGTLKADNLLMDISGSGNINIKDIVAKEIKADVSGSGDISIGGTAEKATCDLSGSGEVDSKNLKTKDVMAVISGSGNINCFAETTLEAEVSGSGNIRYSGAPSVKSKITGSGNVEKE